MTDPFADLKYEADKVPVPPGNAPAAIRRGRSLRRRRIAAAAAMLSLLSVGGIAMARYGLPFSERMDPAKRIEGSEDSVVMRARIATFSFHALKNTIGYRYDYKGVARVADAWIASYRAGVSEAGEQGEPNEIELHIEQESGNFVITEVTGPLSEAQRANLLAYKERIPADTFGYEFFGIELEAAQENRLVVEARTFYIGSIPSGQRSACDSKLVDEVGRVAYRAPRSVVRGLVMAASSTEDDRDGGATGWELRQVIEEAPPPSALHLRVSCHPVEGSWHVVGEARVVSVRPGDVADNSGLPLDPKRHVLVVTKVRFRGQVIGAETICVATVYDAEGDPIDSHGQTIYGPFRERDLTTRGAVQEIRIPVDVGNQSSAVSARVRCQPTIPGVPLGPDQEEGPS